MILPTGKDFIFIFLCGGIVGYYYGSRSRKTQNVIQKKKKEEVHEVIMFSDEGLMSSRDRKQVPHALARVMHYLNRPRHTLDICMYILTHPDLYNILHKLNIKGVKIRVIIDAEMAFASKSYVHRLQRQCIEVRWMKSLNIMHHKFCLIDASTENEQVVPLLLSGSLNWTKQATRGNYENVTVTSQKELVDGYRQEFERLWFLFKPIV